MSESESFLNTKRKSLDYELDYYELQEFEGDEVRKKIRALFKSFYGYSDDNNPFGDPELSRPFIWYKKIKKMRDRGLEPLLESKSLLMRLRDAKKEIERVRRNKQTRDDKREAIEEEKNKFFKQTEEKKYEEWKQKEEKFHLAQEKLRTEIRIKQGREKPIDFIHKVLMIWKGFFPIPGDFLEIPEYHEPYLLYDLLDADTQKELHSDLQTHMQIDVERLANRKFVCFFIDIASNFKQSHDLSEKDLFDFIDYWSAMIVLLDSYIFQEKNLKHIDPDERMSLDQILEGKNIDELNELEKDIVKNREEQILSSDIQFWTNALCALQMHRSRMLLNNIYQDFKLKNSDSLKTLENLKKDNKHGKFGISYNAISHKEEIKSWVEEGAVSPMMYESDEDLRKNSINQHDYLIKLSETRKVLLANQIGNWQKSLNTRGDLKETNINYIELKAKKIKEDKLKLIEEENSDEEAERFLNKIKSKPKKDMYDFIGTMKSGLDILTAGGSFGSNQLKSSRFYLGEDSQLDYHLTQEMLQIESEEMGDGETTFNEVITLANSTYDWESKYKPRKPRYFNKVRTGYEWNKYNQCHYDYDNPPPKVIQGYKFNIFYPDLIDKTKTPQYNIERSDTPDTCILKFLAGPPYEDLAFKIVNREWDMTEKAGFRCTFDRGILFLYFNFKRYRYKR